MMRIIKRLRGYAADFGLRYLVAAVAAFAVIAAIIVPAAAAEYDFDMSQAGQPENTLAEDFKSAFPPDAAEEFSGSFTDPGTAENFGFRYFFDKLLSAVASALPDLAGGFLPLVAALMISAVAAGAYPGAGDGGMWRICSGTVSAGIIFTQRLAMLGTAERFLSIVSGVITASAPAVSALYAATGNITASSVAVSGMLTAIAVISQVFSKIICPAAKLSFFLSVIGAVSGSSRIYALSALIRKVAVWLLTLVMAVVTFALPIQTVLAHSADSVGAAAARFAAGSFIPVVGGAVGEAVTTVSASFSAVKNACGAVGVAAMIVMLIPPITSLFISRMVLTVCSSMADMLSCDTEKKLIDECGGICVLLIAVCLVAALMFIFAMALMVKTGTVMGGG